MMSVIEKSADSRMVESRTVDSRGDWYGFSLTEQAGKRPGFTGHEVKVFSGRANAECSACNPLLSGGWILSAANHPAVVGVIQRPTDVLVSYKIVVGFQN